MDHSGVSGDSCEEKDSTMIAVNANKEITSSANAEDSTAKLTTSMSQISPPSVSESSTIPVTTNINTQPSPVSAIAATGVDMSVSANNMDGKNNSTLVYTGTISQESGGMAVPAGSIIADVRSNTISVSSSVPTSVLSSSTVAERKLTLDSSTGAIPSNTLKLDSSVVKTEQKDLSYIPYQAPVLTAATKAKVSSYDSSKVAAEMAEIDSFLKSLTSGSSGTSSNDSTIKTVPLASSCKPVVNDIVVMPADRSALKRIAQSYGYSDESSSSSSDESEDEELGVTVGSNKMATVAVAMDTSEVEQSIKKVAVSGSSDSSSSSGSDDDLG